MTLKNLASTSVCVLLGIFLTPPALANAKTPIWDCDLTLATQADERFRSLMNGQGLVFIAEGSSGSVETWSAFGHLHAGVHARRDPFVPAVNSGDMMHPRLSWSIHELDVLAEIEWDSTRRDQGNIQVSASVARVGPATESMWGPVREFQMRGRCLRDERSERNFNGGSFE